MSVPPLSVLAARGLALPPHRPVVVVLEEVVPTHLVHPHREQRLELWIDPVLVADEPRGEELVDEEGGGVAVVEDEVVPQPLRPWGSFHV